MNHVPDLFRRFVDAPHRVLVSGGKKSIAVESNERALANCLARFLAASRHMEIVQKIQLVRVIRDNDIVSDGERFTCIHSGPVVALLRGSTTSLFLDVALGELLGFIASDINLSELEQRLLPAILCGSLPAEFANPAGDDKRVTSTASARDNLTHCHN